MRTIIIAIFTLLLFACGNDEFDSFLIPQGTENIIKVSLSPNSPVLIADGKAQLTFKVRAYTEIQARMSVVYNEEGVTMVRDSFFLDTTVLNPDRIAEDQIVILASNGEKLHGLTFTTTDPGEELTFTCQIGEVSSNPCTVKLIKPEIPAFEPRIIPVVFHLLYRSDTKTISEGINETFVSEVLDRLNRVFAGTLAAAPSYLDTKITFIPAETDNTGHILAEKGINRVDLDAEKVGKWQEYDYILENLLWDPEQYLNIWAYDTWSNPDDLSPKYILDNGVEIPGLYAMPVGDISEVEIGSPVDAGMELSIQSMFSMKGGSGDRFEFMFGKFFGLSGTEAEDGYEDEDTDYCSDTYVSLFGPVSVPKRTAIPFGSDEDPIYFDSFNIMDSYSASTTITYEQALRIRQVMENCPLRMMKK